MRVKKVHFAVVSRVFYLWRITQSPWGQWAARRQPPAAPRRRQEYPINDAWDATSPKQRGWRHRWPSVTVMEPQQKLVYQGGTLCWQWRTVLIRYLGTAGPEVRIVLHVWKCPRICVLCEGWVHTKTSVRCANHYVFCSVHCLSQKDLRFGTQRIFFPCRKDASHVLTNAILATKVQNCRLPAFCDKNIYWRVLLKYIMKKENK